MPPDCIDIPLTSLEITEIIGDYIVALCGTALIVWAWATRIISLRLLKAFVCGVILFAPIEYIQPRIGWVYYYKCATYVWAPLAWMWIIHALWDGLILMALLILARWVYGPSVWVNYTAKAAVLMSAVGMLQEILIESTETLWYYVPTRWNPTWAVIHGRNMTLQQWHWSVMPILFYSNYLDG